MDGLIDGWMDGCVCMYMCVCVYVCVCQCEVQLFRLGLSSSFAPVQLPLVRSSLSVTHILVYVNDRVCVCVCAAGVRVFV
jgi:hypothetical protein